MEADDKRKNGKKAGVRAMDPPNNPGAFLDELKSRYEGKILGVQVALTLKDGHVIIAASGGITHREAVYAARMLNYDVESGAFGRSKEVPR